MSGKVNYNYAYLFCCELCRLNTTVILSNKAIFTALLLFLMGPEFNLENLILNLKSRKWHILIFSIIVSASLTAYIYSFSVKRYSAQVKFYVTNSESIDYNTILNKSFIDLSVENRDLNRLRSFGYSSTLLSNVVDSLRKDSRISDREVLEKINSDNADGFIANIYEVTITPLGEIAVTVKCDDRQLAYSLSRQIMLCLNEINNAFLSDFKQEQIEARERQIKLLENEKIQLLQKVDSLSKTVDEEVKIYFGSRSTKDLEKLIASQSSPERIELGLAIQKVNNLSANIEDFKRALYNDRLSLEMLKKKSPYLTQDRAVKSNINLYSITGMLLVSFLFSMIALSIYFALVFRYKRYLKLLFS